MQYLCGKCGWKGEVKTRLRCLACYAKATKQWRQQNPEKAKVQRKRWLLRRLIREPRYRSKRHQIRRQNNPALAKREYTERRKWLKNGRVTTHELRMIYVRDQGCCIYCGEKVTPRFTPYDPRGFDHVIPKCKGGQHEAWNLVICCRRCNEVKGVLDAGAVESGKEASNQNYVGQ